MPDAHRSLEAEVCGTQLLLTVSIRAVWVIAFFKVRTDPRLEEDWRLMHFNFSMRKSAPRPMLTCALLEVDAQLCLPKMPIQHCTALLSCLDAGRGLLLRRHNRVTGQFFVRIKTERPNVLGRVPALLNLEGVFGPNFLEPKFT
jgi:hypothetical protein